MAETSKKQKIFDSRYEILEIIGRGASSVVYRAKHVLVENKEIALKVLNANKIQNKNSDLLRKESLALITARHKHTIRLEDFRSVGEICYLAMEYAPLSDLRAYTKSQGGKLSILQAERFLKQISSSLSFIHDIGMVHRDVKPDNILVLNERQVKISDFGVSILPGQNASIEELQKGVGTMDYMSPEVFEGTNCTPASDVYSLAITFYEIFSGKHPFENLPLAKALKARQESDITPLSEMDSGIPPVISSAISKALSYNIEDRFKNGTEFLNYINNPNAVTTPTEEKEDSSEFSSIHTGKTTSAFVAKESVEELSTKESDHNEKEIRQSKDVSKAEEVSKKESKDYENGVEEFIESVQKVDTRSKTTEVKVEEIVPAEIINKTTEEKKEEDDVIPSHNEYSNETLSDSDHTTLEEFDYEHTYEVSTSSIWSKLLFVGLALFAGYLLLKLLILPFFTDSPTSLNELYTSEEAFIIPQEGVYIGEVKDTTTGSYPISVISFESQNKIVVLLGKQGWTPISIDLNNTKNALLNRGILEVKSNGDILYLKAKATNDVLEGELVDIKTGIKNNWTAKISKNEK